MNLKSMVGKSSALEKAWKCYRYRDMDTAIFLMSLVIEKMPEYRLVYGILLFENQEYKRALFHLNGLLTTTAVYYRALCLFRMKKYNEAAVTLENILNRRTLKDSLDDEWGRHFLVESRDTEFFEQILGEIYVRTGMCMRAVNIFKKLMRKNPLFGAASYLLNEQIFIDKDSIACEDINSYKIINKYKDNKTYESNNSFNDSNAYKTSYENKFKTKNLKLSNRNISEKEGFVNNILEDPVIVYYLQVSRIIKDISLRSENPNKLRSMEKNTRFEIDRHPSYAIGGKNDSSESIDGRSFVDNLFYGRVGCNILVDKVFGGSSWGDEKYSPEFNTPFFGTYFMVKVATALGSYGFDAESISLFERVRELDPMFLNEMDYYSTVLWKTKKESCLGLLAKECIDVNPMHHAVWIAIGNYYSLKGISKKCILCFKRSLAIKETSHAHTLLGFEYNTRNQFIDAQKNFSASIAISAHNDRALFGLGISYANSYNRESALLYFNKALQINPTSLPMITYLVRFYVKNKEMNEAFNKIVNVIFPGYHNLAIDYETLVNLIEKNAGRFHELEELMLCELAEILFSYNCKAFAIRVLRSLECRTSTYFSKRALIENSKLKFN